jgi:hypothetical protein
MSARIACLTINHIFFGYMALVGVSTGAVLIAMPSAGDGWFKPYFWVLVAVAVFDVTIFLLQRARPAMTAVPMEAKLLGFVIGIVSMVAIPTLANSPARFF